MKMIKLNKIISIIILIIIVAIFIYALIKPNNSKTKLTDKLSVVCTSFVGYDFVKAITKDSNNIEITYLLDSGVDAHNFEPTASQIIAIQQSDLFVYNGGEMENWTEQVIPTIDVSNTKLIKLMDTVELFREEHIDGVEEDKEHEELAWDEHVWTSPKNAIKMLESLELGLEEIEALGI